MPGGVDRRRYAETSVQASAGADSAKSGRRDARRAGVAAAAEGEHGHRGERPARARRPRPARPPAVARCTARLGQPPHEAEHGEHVGHPEHARDLELDGDGDARRDERQRRHEDGDQGQAAGDQPELAGPRQPARRGARKVAGDHDGVGRVQHPGLDAPVGREQVVLAGQRRQPRVVHPLDREEARGQQAQPGGEADAAPTAERGPQPRLLDEERDANPADEPHPRRRDGRRRRPRPPRARARAGRAAPRQGRAGRSRTPAVADGSSPRGCWRRSWRCDGGRRRPRRTRRSTSARRAGESAMRTSPA